jgi:hypothetical protein
MPRRIPIKAARDVSRAYACTQVIILAQEADGRAHVVTYGRSREDCRLAAEAGNNLKRIMGWPEELCNEVPARVVRAQNPQKEALV